MLNIKATPKGLEIVFIEALAEGKGEKTDDYMIQQWKYESTPRFGGDKLELESLSPNNVIVSPDRKTVHLGIRGPKEKSR